MTEKDFQKYVQGNRDCNEQLLNAAISKGLRRAKTEHFAQNAVYKLDYAKLWNLAATFAITMGLAITLQSEQSATAVGEFMASNSIVTADNSVILHEYFANFANTIIKFLGGTL